MGLNVELDDDAVDSVVVQALKYQYNRLNEDLFWRKSGKRKYGVFYKDKEKDIEEIQRHLSALATVLMFNMTQNDFEEWRNKA